MCSGSSGGLRCSPEEYLVASGDAVTGNGFRLTGDGDGEVVDTVEKALGLMVNEGGPGRVFRLAWAESSG